MAKVYRSICNELDSVSLKILHLSEKGITYKLKVEQIMNHGFVNLAKARYIMGSKCVSSLQLPTQDSNPITAVSTVCRAEYQQHIVFKLHRKTPCSVSSDENLDKDKPGVHVTKTDDVRKMFEMNVEGLRNRKDALNVKNKDYQALKEDMLDEISTNAESESSISSYCDPIRLFGILVPQTLRVAQQSFVSSLELLIDCATIQSQTDTYLKRYYHLLEVKRLIEKSTVGRDINIYDDREYWTPFEVSTPSICEKVAEEQAQEDICAEMDIYAAEEESFTDRKHESLVMDNRTESRKSNEIESIEEHLGEGEGYVIE